MEELLLSVISSFTTIRGGFLRMGSTRIIIYLPILIPKSTRIQYSPNKPASSTQTCPIHKFTPKKLNKTPRRITQMTSETSTSVTQMIMTSSKTRSTPKTRTSTSNTKMKSTLKEMSITTRGIQARAELCRIIKSQCNSTPPFKQIGGGQSDIRGIRQFGIKISRSDTVGLDSLIVALQRRTREGSHLRSQSLSAAVVIHIMYKTWGGVTYKAI